MEKKGSFLVYKSYLNMSNTLPWGSFLVGVSPRVG